MWLFLIGLSIGLIYLYLKNNYNYWKKRGVDTPPFHYVVGNLWKQLTLKKNAGLVLQDEYNAFKGYNYFGYYNALQPAIVVRNPEIIGDILIKDFQSFADNDFDIDEEMDPIFGKNPFILKGQRWKHVRAQSTPSFSSGKIKAMMPLIKETNTTLLNYMKKFEGVPVELDPLNNKITADNVASCAFGLEGGSFTQEKPRFVEFAKEPINPTTMNIIKGFMIFVCPSLARIIKVKFFRQETIDYLKGVIEQTMQYRKDNNVQRNDLLDEMKRIREKVNDDKVFSFFDILGHAGGFLLDGIVTSSITADHALYDIAKNADVQDKLRKEIENVLSKHNGELTYESIQEMEYLDCVLKESLRLHPPLMFMTKRVTKPYTMKPMREDNTGPQVELAVGTPVIIPLLALHLDELFFPEPEKFDAERWNRENKDKHVKNSYLPFSDGPRACLGMRFGVLQTKITLITIIQNYKISPSSKTKEPLDILPASFVNVPTGGHWVEFTKL